MLVPLLEIEEPQRAYSIKTRIKTCDAAVKVDAANRTQRAYSIKTRIKTAYF